jgi:hypothetical protein
MKRNKLVVLGCPFCDSVLDKNAIMDHIIEEHREEVVKILKRKIILKSYRIIW